MKEELLPGSTGSLTRVSNNFSGCLGGRFFKLAAKGMVRLL